MRLIGATGKPPVAMVGAFGKEMLDRRRFGVSDQIFALYLRPKSFPYSENSLFPGVRLAGHLDGGFAYYLSSRPSWLQRGQRAKSRV